MITVQYDVIGCQWCVHASRECNKEVFRIKTMHSSDIYDNGMGMTSHLKASKKWVSSFIIQILKDRSLYRVVVFSGTYCVSIEYVCCIGRLGWEKRLLGLLSMKIRQSAMIFLFGKQTKWLTRTRVSLRLWRKTVSGLDMYSLSPLFVCAFLASEGVAGHYCSLKGPTCLRNKGHFTGYNM